MILDDLKKELEIAKIELKSKTERLKIDPTQDNANAVQDAQRVLDIAQMAYDAEQRKAQDEDKKLKAAEKEELNELQRYEQFCNARDAHKQYNFAFQRRNGEFFITKVFVDRDKNDPEIERCTTEIESYSYELLSKAFIELEHKVARSYLRRMMEGKPFKINKGENEWEEWEGPRRIYHKLVNTINVPDPDTYNIINLDGIVKPTAEEHECPWILKCLFRALGAGKEENIEHVEKWVYSTCVADIGNNQTPFPVFYGKGKIGKNALFELVIAAILGKECVFTSTWGVVGESNFNQFKLGKVLIFIDEIPERSEWTKIKNWTGSTTEYIKVKYGPEYSIDNVTALAFGSNEPNFPLPWEDGEQMMRVSPLKAGSTTFAEYVVAYARDKMGLGVIEDLVKGKIGYVPETDHLIGDKFLRAFKPEWVGKEQIQQLVNYLHTKYDPGKGRRFVLTPLRGEDWEELTQEKKDYVYRALDWAMGKKLDYIVIEECYAIYEHMNKLSNKKNYKGSDSFYRMAAEYLKQAGWIKNAQTYVEYLNTYPQAYKDDDKKKSVSRKAVYFRKEEAVKKKVASLLDVYFKEVKTNVGIKSILNDGDVSAPVVDEILDESETDSNPPAVLDLSRLG